MLVVIGEDIEYRLESEAIFILNQVIAIEILLICS